MKVFISWSGRQAEAVALALRDWLPSVLQSVMPFVSSEDIGKGARWASDLNTELEQTNFGIICLTRENLTAPWLLFEAGALSKRLDVGIVAPVLHGLSKSDVTLPLSAFQLTDATQEDILKLMQAMNAATAAPLSEERVERQVAMWWPELDERLTAIPRAQPSSSLERQVPAPERNEREMLEELLDLVRDLARARPSGAVDVSIPTDRLNLSESKRRNQRAHRLSELREGVEARLKDHPHLQQYRTTFDGEKGKLDFHVSPRIVLSPADVDFIESQAAQAGVAVSLCDMEGKVFAEFPPF